LRASDAGRGARDAGGVAATPCTERLPASGRMAQVLAAEALFPGEMSASTRPRAQRGALLLAACHGARHLAGQPDSAAARRHREWALYVSDDGSSDATPDLIADFARHHGGDRVHLVDGPCRGFVANYLSLACRTDLDAEYFAFCDQDDVWQPDHLSRAVAWLA